MKLNNNILALLVNNGMATLDYSTVSAAHAYKVYKLRRSLLKAFDELREQTQELIKTVLTEEELNAKAKLEEEKKMDSEQYRALIKKINESEVINALYNEEIEVKCANLPFEEFFKLQQANEFLRGPGIDELLEGVFWKEEDEEEKKQEKQD